MITRQDRTGEEYTKLGEKVFASILIPLAVFIIGFVVWSVASNEGEVHVGVWDFIKTALSLAVILVGSVVLGFLSLYIIFWVLGWLWSWVIDITNSVKERFRPWRS